MRSSRLATTDPTLDVSLLENRILAALPSPLVLASTDSSLIETSSGLLGIDSSEFATGSSCAAPFGPTAGLGGSPALAVPEPSTLLLAAMGSIGFVRCARRRSMRRNAKNPRKTAGASPFARSAEQNGECPLPPSGISVALKMHQSAIGDESGVAVLGSGSTTL